VGPVLGHAAKSKARGRGRNHFMRIVYTNNSKYFSSGVFFLQNHAIMMVKGDAMKKLILASLFFILGAFVLSAQNLPSIQIVNDTGYTFYYLYVSPSESDKWGDDILGDKILRSGETFTFRLPQPLSSVNVYDFLAEDEDEDPYYKYEVTITNNARIVFTFDDCYFD
jgi:hypothetical protein